MINTVIDTNVVVSALISRNDASFKLLSLVGTQYFDIHLFVPLVLEYEDAAKRLIGTRIQLSAQMIDDVIDYVCSVGHERSVFNLWRPMLKDPRDDMVLELAISAACEYIVTHNLADFEGSQRFGVQAITPKSFLQEVGVLS